MRDQEGSFAGILWTHMPETIPDTCEDLTDFMSVLFGPDFGVDESKRDGYGFVSIHCHFYNRFSESVSAESHFLPHI
jgi:hypothetical protein